MATNPVKSNGAAAAHHTPAPGADKAKASETDKKATAAAAKALAAASKEPATGSKRKATEDEGAAAAHNAKKTHAELDLSLPADLQNDLKWVMDEVVRVTTPGVFGDAGIKAYLLVPANREFITKSEQSKRLVASGKHFAIAEHLLNSPKKDAYITALKKLASLAKDAGAFSSEKEVSLYHAKRELHITTLTKKGAKPTPEQQQAIVFCQRYSLKKEEVLKRIHKETPLEFLDAVIEIIEEAAKKGVKA